MPNLMTKIIGDPNEREVKRARATVAKIDARGDDLKKLSDDELSDQTASLRARLEKGEKLDDRIDGLRPGIDFLWSDWSEWFKTFNAEHGVLSDNVCCYVARGHL